MAHKFMTPKGKRIQGEAAKYGKGGLIHGHIFSDPLYAPVHRNHT